MGCFVRTFFASSFGTLKQRNKAHKRKSGKRRQWLPQPAGESPVPQSPLHRQLAYLLCSPCVSLLAVRTHASEATHPRFGADTRFGHRRCGLVSCTLQEPTLQEPRRDPRGAGHVRRRMPRPDATPRCVGRQELCNRVGELPSSPRLSRRQGGHGRSASRRHLAVLEIQRCAIARRRLGLRMRGLHDHSQPVPCRAECARPQAVSGVRRTQLRSNAAGLSSARHCAQAADQSG